MDTIIFGLILAAVLIIIFSAKRWLAVAAYFVAFAATAFLFLHHMTSTLNLEF
jgi:hypothetical protein